MDRITLEPGKRGGRPCIRGLRISVYDVLAMLSSGMSQQEILEDLNLPLFDVPLSHFIMRPSIAVPRPSVSQTASD